MSTTLGSTREKVARALFARDCEIAIADLLARRDIAVGTRLSAGKQIVDLYSRAEPHRLGSLFTGHAFERMHHGESREAIIAHVAQIAVDHTDLVLGTRVREDCLDDTMRASLRLSLLPTDLYNDLGPQNHPIRFDYLPLELSGHCLHLSFLRNNILSAVLPQDRDRWGETNATLLSSAKANMVSILTRGRAHDVHRDPHSGITFSLWEDTAQGFDSARLAFPATSMIRPPQAESDRVVLFAAPRRDIFLAAECTTATIVRALDVLHAKMKEEASGLHPLITQTIFRWLPNGDYEHIIPIVLAQADGDGR